MPIGEELAKRLASWKQRKSIVPPTTTLTGGRGAFREGLYEVDVERLAEGVNELGLGLSEHFQDSAQADDILAQTMQRVGREMSFLRSNLDRLLGERQAGESDAQAPPPEALRAVSEGMTRLETQLAAAVDGLVGAQQDGFDHLAKVIRAEVGKVLARNGTAGEAVSNGGGTAKEQPGPGAQSPESGAPTRQETKPVTIEQCEEEWAACGIPVAPNGKAHGHKMTVFKVVCHVISSKAKRGMADEEAKELILQAMQAADRLLKAAVDSATAEGRTYIVAVEGFESLEPGLRAKLVKSAASRGITVLGAESVVSVVRAFVPPVGKAEQNGPRRERPAEVREQQPRQTQPQAAGDAPAQEKSGAEATRPAGPTPTQHVQQRPAAARPQAATPPRREPDSPAPAQAKDAGGQQPPNGTNRQPEPAAPREEKRQHTPAAIVPEEGQAANTLGESLDELGEAAGT